MSSDGKHLSILVLTKNYFVDSLRSFGHKVITVGFNKGNFELHPDDVKKHTRPGSKSSLLAPFDFFSPPAVDIREILDNLPSGFNPDVIVYHDDSNPFLYVSGLEELSIPLVFFSVDIHLHSERHRIYSGLFDRTLIAQKDFVDSVKDYCPNSFWFPLWCRIDAEPASDRDIPVVFRGSIDPRVNPKRAEFLRALADLTPIDTAAGSFCDVFKRAKIVVNQAIQGDVNFRVFEAMMCGAMLLTPRIENGQHDLFQPGVHLAEYTDNDAQDAAAKIAYFLNHDEERQKIARAGRELVIKHHSECVRARQFEEHLYSAAAGGRPKRHSAALFHYVRRAKLESWVIRKPEKAQTALRKACENALKCVLKKEALDGQFLTDLLSCKCLLIASSYNEDALSLMRSIWQHTHPNMLYLSLYAGTLLQLGRRSEAQALAASTFDRPLEFLKMCEEKLTRMEEKVLDHMHQEMRAVEIDAAGLEQELEAVRRN